MKCNTCGNLISENTKECAVCGAPVDKEAQPKTTINTLSEKNSQLLILSILSLFILFFEFIIDLTIFADYTRFSNTSIKVLGIFGIIFSLYMFFAILIMIILMTFEIFKDKLPAYKKISGMIPKLGLFLHLIIVLFTFILMLWQTILFESAVLFFQPIFLIFLPQIISVWLFYLAVKPKNILDKVEKVEK